MITRTLLTKHVAYGGTGRRIPVPDRLPYPNPTIELSMESWDRQIKESLTIAPQTCWRTLQSLLKFNRTEPWQPRREKAFRDDLIDLLPPRFAPPDYEKAARRSLQESAASAALARVLTSRDDFIPTLRLIHDIRIALGLPACLRRGRVSTVPDVYNNVVDYPAAADVPSLIVDIDIFRQRYGDSKPFCSAVVTFVAIVHAHPFSDGNGRTARIAFNVLTSLAKGATVSLPIAVIALLSEGAFVLKLRRAMLGGEWQEIFRFFTESAHFFTEVNSAVCGKGDAEWVESVS